MKRYTLLILTFLTSALLSASVRLSACAPAQPATLTIITHDSVAISEDVDKAFETAINVTLVFLPSGGLRWTAT